jgi:MFS family permease
MKAEASPIPAMPRAQQDASAGAFEAQRGVTLSHAWLFCVLLTASYAVSYMDRSIINLLVTPIEHELQLSDSGVSSLIGIAFALPYVLGAFPIAILSDRGNRRRIILCGMAVWCLATALCATAKSLPMLFWARVFVGAGEGVLIPAATSMLADYFAPGLRARAMGLFSAGPYIGGGVALIGGGALVKVFSGHPLVAPVFGELSPWRAVLLVIGGAGLLLLPLVALLREPPRGVSEARPGGQRLSFGGFFRAVPAASRALGAHYVGFALLSLGVITLTSWGPTLFVRHHQWSVGQAGLRMGLLALVLAPLGAFGGAKTSEWLAMRGRTDAKLLVGIGTGLICTVAAVLATLDSAAVGLIGFAFAQLFGSFNYGVLHAALTELLPNSLRARGVAVFTILTGLISISAGPALVALFTDHVFHSPAALHLSLRCIVPPAFLLGAVILTAGRKPYRATVAAQR